MTDEVVEHMTSEGNNQLKSELGLFCETSLCHERKKKSGR